MKIEFDEEFIFDYKGPTGEPLQEFILAVKGFRFGDSV